MSAAPIGHCPCLFWGRRRRCSKSIFNSRAKFWRCKSTLQRTPSVFPALIPPGEEHTEEPPPRQMRVAWWSPFVLDRVSCVRVGCVCCVLGWI